MRELDPRIRAELAAMDQIVAALDGLSEEAQARVIRWLADRYAVAV